MEKRVVKCSNDKCRQYFMLVEKDAQCPFCYTAYGEDRKEVKERKVPIKSAGESFNIWKAR